MGDEKRSDTEKEQKSGLTQISAMHVIIAVVVIVLAVIFVAKFGFGMDLISPSSGEMAIVKRPVTPVPTIMQNPAIRPSISLRPETIAPCNAPKMTCGDSCIDINSDPNNCGGCGRVCSDLYKDRKNVAAYGCSAGKCTISSCKPGYGYCDMSPRLDLNPFGCDYDFKTGVTSNYNGDYVYDSSTPNSKLYPDDPRSCGACGNTCPSGGSQHFGICENSACRDVCWGVWMNCDNNWGNGCEQAMDENNCGACGAKCPANTICKTGCCVIQSNQTRVADSLGVVCSGHVWARLNSH
jgi:hypothetical protein